MPVNAKNLGILGRVYPIKEIDAYMWITKTKLPELQEQGAIAAMLKKLQNQARENMESPKNYSELPRATKYKKFEIDLTVKSLVDIKDTEGKIIVAANTQVNPLQLLPDLHKSIVFINGDDLEQITWALSKYKNNIFCKLVLVKGAIQKLTERHQLKFYFDQYGLLINHFGINNLPAVVSRQGDRLWVEEIKL